ncbi:MAG: nucleoside 2-deoxyribosyltransferase [Candidatus Pacebacteria bacterium]|jgi:nucleoside 2-deoxyribosyltransferase|nr:nucleoside 2-deoxyribosyltransferase [Candidatus Paceibacterota bacterium]
MKDTILYLAAPLFGAGERLHNLYLERYLKDLGYRVVLPQRDAKKFIEAFPRTALERIKEHCRKSAEESTYLYVGCVDGPDADSGTCVEYGLALAAKGKAIIYRTDIRTDATREVGLNAMLTLKGTTYIHFPCYITELHEAQPYYQELAQKIHETVQSL